MLEFGFPKTQQQQCCRLSGRTTALGAGLCSFNGVSNVTVPCPQTERALREASSHALPFLLLLFTAVCNNENCVALPRPTRAQVMLHSELLKSGEYAEWVCLMGLVMPQTVLCQAELTDLWSLVCRKNMIVPVSVGDNIA